MDSIQIKRTEKYSETKRKIIRRKGNYEPSNSAVVRQVLFNI